MKRDCGNGDLIPVKYFIKYQSDSSDRERTIQIDNPYSHEYDAVLFTLPPLGNIRLYARDKAGYCNCIRSDIIGSDGICISTDRRAELNMNGQD